VTEPVLLHELAAAAAARSPDAAALTSGQQTWSYGELTQAIEAAASGLVELGLRRGQRLGVWLDKRFETVVACFAATSAGSVFVPLNPLLKPNQVAHILADCNVRVLVTSADRLALLSEVLPQCPDLKDVVVVADASAQAQPTAPHALRVTSWLDLAAAAPRPRARVIDCDMAAILYTSGSTGRPKGVVLSHRNMVAGAKSVASYLGNHDGDTLLAALPLSFDAGFSQLTTAFHAGARVVLLNYLLPRDVLLTLERERVTGLTAVPPLYIQLTQFECRRRSGVTCATLPIPEGACHARRWRSCARAYPRRSPS
jgi:acyl-CoA synthetase (AMP-forming)/AMP-acid ligase II